MTLQWCLEAEPLPNIGNVGTFAVLVCFVMLQILGQQATYAREAERPLSIEVSRDGEAKVTQEITSSTTVSRISVTPVTTNISNILAVDENNIVLSYSDSNGSITIDSLGSPKVTLTYDAKIVNKAGSGNWDLNYNSTIMQSTIILPSMSEILFVNNIPIDIVDNIVTMPPGEVSIRFKIKSVELKEFVVAWDLKNYIVQVVTASEVQGFRFEQSSKSIEVALDTSTATLVIIPKSLLGGPYTVDSPTGDRVDFRQYYQNSTHSWIRVEPNGLNAIRIVGTTVVPEFPLLTPTCGLAVAIVLLISVINKRSMIWRQ